MRGIFLSLCFVATVGLGVERTQLDVMLQTAATNSGPAYLVARTALTNACVLHPTMLATAATDTSLTWQQRLAARIAYERLVREPDIAALRVFNWQTHPLYDVKWEMCIVGPYEGIRTIAIPEITRCGLWYYYIELIWKNTQETSDSRIPRLATAWPWWCVEVVKTEPESRFLWLAMIERLDTYSQSLDDTGVRIYRTLENNAPNAIPVLICRFDAYQKATVCSLEPFPGANAQNYLGKFTTLISHADSRHISVVQKFIASNSVLAPLYSQLSSMSARNAMVDQPEPPFRLNTNLVVAP